MNQYKKLTIWLDSVQLAVDVCRRTQQFPKEELFGLTSQIRRSAISISSNIAEGACRNNDTEFKHFLGIASGSSGELDTQLLIAQRLNFIDLDEYESLKQRIESIQKRNFTLQKNLAEKISNKKNNK